MSWIKIRTTLVSDPRVNAIAASLNINRNAVVGALVAVWSFADAHSVDGRLPWTTRDDIDGISQLPGFARAMFEVGWLDDGDPSGVVLPRFVEHNGESAKARAQGAKRVERYRRNAASVTGSGHDGVTREEKRRE